MPWKEINLMDQRLENDVTVTRCHDSINSNLVK
jgi:hypothetical protein